MKPGDGSVSTGGFENCTGEPVSSVTIWLPRSSSTKTTFQLPATSGCSGACAGTVKV